MIDWRRPVFGKLSRRGRVSAMSAAGSEFPDYSASDWLLLWLAIGESKEIRGKTVFVKQIFVIAEEVIPQILQKFNFYSHHFGPYSKEFETALQQLVRMGMIDERMETDVEGLFSTNARHDYTLLPKGEARAVELLKGVPSSIKEKLVQHKRLLSRMGYIGLLSYVYNTYPTFTMNSELELA